MPKRSKKRAAWGSLTEVSAGVWRLRYWARGDDGSYRRRSRTVRGTRVDAERERARLMLDHSEEAPCPTVGDVWERWYWPAIERRVEEDDLSTQSISQYRSAWRRHIGPRWSDVPCDAVRPLEVQQWLDGLGRSAATISLAVCRPLMDYAVRYGLVETNPMRERYILPGRSTVDSRDKGIWSLAQLRELWSAVEGAWFEPAFLLAGFGGMRVGESLGVMASDVCFLQGVVVVSVKRQITSSPSLVTERLKNPQSRRSVPIPGRAGDRIMRIAGERSGFLSGDGMGGFSPQIRLVRAWNSAMCSLDKSMRHPFRNLRNSWETNARWSLGLDGWTIEVLMGHVPPGVTGRHYDRPTTEMLAKAVSDAYAATPFDADWDELGR